MVVKVGVSKIWVEFQSNAAISTQFVSEHWSDQLEGPIGVLPLAAHKRCRRSGYQIRQLHKAMQARWGHVP
jgi:hypothetical protein